jgi:acetylornithine/N-succinyldiaminopimelate aminotransferase
MNEPVLATEELRRRFAAALMHTYADVAPDIALAFGKGCRVSDVDGKEYLDLAAGLTASSLGHGHPELAAAIAVQSAEIIHTSNQFLHQGEVELAEWLCRLVRREDHPDTVARVFLCNSGTEANEAAVKLARLRQGAGRPVFVSTTLGFHGRTMGTMPLAGAARVRDPFVPFGIEVRFVPHGDAEALASAVREDTAAVFLEPILGEAGVICPPDGYLRAAREICDTAGALLVLDEVQTGVGRTGTWFAYEREGVVPDVVTLAKGLAGGVPVGACIGFGDCATTLRGGHHGSTFGGNPLACAAALTVLRVIERDGLLASVTAVGSALAEGIAAIDHPLLAGVRGRGLLQAITLTSEVSQQVSDAAARAGFLVGAIRPDVVRLSPPLIFSEAEAAEFTAALPGILAEAL